VRDIARDLAEVARPAEEGARAEVEGDGPAAIRRAGQ